MHWSIKYILLPLILSIIGGGILYFILPQSSNDTIINQTLDKSPQCIGNNCQQTITYNEYNLDMPEPEFTLQPPIQMNDFKTSVAVSFSCGALNNVYESSSILKIDSEYSLTQIDIGTEDEEIICLIVTPPSAGTFQSVSGKKYATINSPSSKEYIIKVYTDNPIKKFPLINYNYN